MYLWAAVPLRRGVPVSRRRAAGENARACAADGGRFPKRRLSADGYETVGGWTACGNTPFRKLLLALPVLLGITIIDYAIMCMAGSPLDMMISPRATQEAIAAKAQQLRLDQPVTCNMCAGWGRFCRATWVTRIRAISL